MEEADRQRLDPLALHQFARGDDGGIRVERPHHLAVVAEPFRHLAAQAARNHRFGEDQAEIEEVVAPLHRDIEDVAEPLAHQHAGLGALALDHRVGDQSSAVDDAFQLGDVDSVAGQHHLQALQHRFGRIARRRQLLVDGEPTAFVVQQGEVGEGAADVDAEAISHGSSPLRP